MRRRARQFDPDLRDFRRAIHWLWQRGVPRELIGQLFGKSANLVSVSAHMENKAEVERKRSIILPSEPDFTLVSDDPYLGDPGKSTVELAEEVEQASDAFWASVRSLGGIPVYGDLLQRLSKRSEEDILARRLRVRLKKMIAETYIHAGYAKSAIMVGERVLEMAIELYNVTQDRADLVDYAKTCLLISLARTQREEWNSALRTIDLAERALAAADVPIDPEIYRQRAFILFEQGKDTEAETLFTEAFDVFPEHRDFLGFGQGEHARHDVGRRPLATLTGNFELALENLEISSAWPVGAIHHAINLNAAIATALLSDSAEAKPFIEDNMDRAVELARGFGHQSTIIHLLRMTSRIPKELRKGWIRFALNYNAYRNR